jgi:mono/diheme cytochrome c family protein
MAATRRTGRARAIGLALLCALFVAGRAGAQTRLLPERDGATLYRAACAACHAVDGRGAPQSLVGFDTPLPDFTDCSFASREPAADWFAVAHAGGPVRAFDRRMPAFGDVLSEAEIERTIEHVSAFCSDRAWPRGELNLPRPLVTEKAYPEDEAVVTATVDTASPGSVRQQFVYEKRIGARSQYEVAVPFAVRQSPSGAWQRGLGDVAVAVKHTLAHSLARGSIVSVGGEVVLPTGKESQGLGKGVTVFEPFLAVGQVLPANMFVHAQAGAELATNRSISSHETFWRGAVGRTFEQGRFGRAWSPMVEVLGGLELESDEHTQWDVLPQMQVTLSKRQHIMISGGIRLPLTDRDRRRPQIITYFLWDWFDGGLTDGWR